MYKLSKKIKVVCRAVIVLCISVLMGHSAWASTILTNLSVQKLSPVTVDIVLTFDQSIQPNSAVIHEQPHKLIIELPNTGHALSKRIYLIEHATLKQLFLAQGDEKTQLIFDVVRVPFYSIAYEGNTLKIAVRRRLAGQTSMVVTSEKKIKN